MALPPRSLAALLVLLLCTAAPQAQQLRKIGEMELAVVGLSAAVDGARPAIPKNVASGVRVRISAGGTPVAPGAVARLLGPFSVEGELSGPSFGETVTVRHSVDVSTTAADLILPLPVMAISGEHTLANLRIVGDGRPLFDLQPRTVPIDVIEQVLITSVKTRPLTLQEIKDRGIVLDSDDYLGFEFTLGLLLESKAVAVNFPVVFNRQGVALPLPQSVPSLRVDNLADPIAVPRIVPMMLTIPKLGPGLGLGLDFDDEDIRIPSVLVIPGEVGYLRQFFSAQLFVGNGTPGTANLTVRAVTGTLILPPGADLVRGTADDPLSLAETVNGVQPLTMAIAAVGPDGLPATADDVTALRAGEQGQAEFLVRGDLEGYHSIAFDIAGELEGLATGPVTVTGRATGGVLVRNPFFDVSFVVPTVVRRSEPFTLYATVTNKGQGIANDVSMTLDAAALSGVTLLSDASLSIDTLKPGDAKTLAFRFEPQRTGQVVASYLRFTGPGATGNLVFRVGVGERGVVLSPDTLVLPAQVDVLPGSIVDTAMRVLGQAWSIANAPPNTLPAGVTRIAKTVVTAKAVALAEAGLRISLGQPETDAIRDLIPDFHGPSPVDRGFDQLLRTTDAGRNFDAAVGAVLAAGLGAGPAAFERDFSQVAASGRDFMAFSVSNGSAGAGVDVKLSDAAARTLVFTGQGGDAAGEVTSAAIVPLGPASSAPLFGYIAAPASGPYTLDLTGRSSGPVDLTVTYPRGDGLFTRAAVAGAMVPLGAAARFSIDPSRAPPLFEIDTDGNGTIDVTTPMAVETIAPVAPKLLSATVVGPETFPSAGPYGLSLALLFDRIVDPAAAAQLSRYTIPDNRVVSARSQLSGRLVIGSMAQPEGPYVPTTVTVAGMSDLRGMTAGSETRALQSRLVDPGAVVTGRVIGGDGAAAAGIRVIYHNNVNVTCETPIIQPSDALAAVVTDAAGRYQYRYVWRDRCGGPWRMHAIDEARSSERSVSGAVRAPGERTQADIALLGRGAVTGIVRDLSGTPVANAQVIAVSTLESQIGGSTRTDGDGRYTIFDLTVGPVTVKAAKGISVGTATAQIARAGTTATADVSLNSGSVSVSGTVRKLEGGVTTIAAGATVIFEGPDPLGSQPRITGVATASGDGAYAFTAMPSGPYTIRAALTTGDFSTIAGTAEAGDTLTGRDLLIPVLANATVSGMVRFPDGTPAPSPTVLAPSGGTQGRVDGTFTIDNVKFASSPQKLTAYSNDGLRQGQATVLLNQSGQVLDGVVITLSGLGTLDLLVIDSAGQPVRNQIVLMTRVGRNISPNSCTGFNLVPTNAQGHAIFENLEVGAVRAHALRATATGVDVTEYDGTIPYDGATVSGVMRFGGGGIVRGTVRDDLGQPVFGAEIEVSSRVYQGGTCELWPGVSHRLRTDLNGQYRATGVPVGAVSVKASQAFFPTPIGASGVIARDGDELVLDMQLVNTIAGELSGTVFLPDGVTPAGAGVTVTALGTLPDVVVSTNAEGKFRFAKIFPAGTLQVTVRDPQTAGVARENVVLRTGENATHDFRLKGRGSVRVNVVDGAGVAVSAALVTLKESDYPNETFEGVVDPSNEGVVTFENVHEGRFSVTASDIFARGGRVSGELASPGTTVDVTVRMTVTGTVTGHFYMPDGVTPIPFGTIRLVAGNKVIGQANTTSGADSGAFEFAYVPAGTVRLEGLDPATGRSGLAIGQLTTDGQLLNLDVRAQGLGTVTGLITSNAVAQPGARATVSSGSFRAQATADADGRYLVPGVPEGTVSVTADLQGALQGVASASLLGDGATLSLDVALRASGVVTGVITSADGVTPAPPSIVSIVVGSGGGRYTATTNQFGGYTFDLVPAGTATLSVDVIGSIDTATTSFEVLGARTNNVPLQLIGLGSITGLARDSTGTPIGGTVTLTGSGAVPYTLTLTAGPDGSFYAAQVLAGPYSAKLRSTVGGFTLYGTSSGVVTPAATSNVTVTLQSTGDVRGVVVRADGVTVAIGANVTLTSGVSTIASTQSLSAGAFSFTGVPLGTYSVTVHDVVSNGYARALNLVLAQNGDIGDVGTLVLDDAAVSVVSVSPAEGAIGVSRTAPVVVTFSDALAGTSGVNIKNGTTTLGPARSLSADGKTLTLTSTWPDSAELTVEVTTGVTDIFGRHPAAVTTSRFRTVDTTAPSVLSITPASGAIQVPGETAIDVTFSEPIANATADGLVSLVGPGGPLTGTAEITSPTTIRFTPAAPLSGNALFSASVDGAVDASGNEQGAAFVASFATVDTVPPVLTATSPATTGWVTDATPFIRVAVSDAVSGVLSTTGTLSLDGIALSPTRTSTDITFTAPTLADGPHTIDATVADKAGNLGSLQATFTLDATAPSGAAITNVSEGQVVAGLVTITAAAVDAGSGVARIELRRNGSTVLTLLPPTFSGTWNATSTADGPWSLTARAYDVAGNGGADSAAIGIVVDNAPLVVTITAPVTSFRTRRPVTAAATVNEPVQRVEFMLGAVTVSDATSPYSAVLDVSALPEGNATITVRAVGLLNETATATRSIVIDRSAPVARWPFDEGAGLTTADASGNGHIGTLANGTAWSVLGQFGKSISLDGVDDGVTALDGDDLDATAALTLSAWVSPTASGTVQSIVYKSGAPLPAYTLAIGADGRAEAVIYPAGNAAVVQSVAPVPLQAWTHLAATYDGVTLRLFVNGAAVATTPATGELPVTDGAVWLGRSDVGNAFRGRLDETRINDRALSAAEVQALGASQRAGSRLSAGFRASFVAQPGGPVWSFGQGGNTLGRSSGTATPAGVPGPVTGLTDVVAINSSNSHSLALTAAGGLYAWGSNSSGEIGDGTTTGRAAPVPIALDTVVAVATGTFHSLALLANGDVYAWGSNASGQFGDGTTAGSLVPRLVQTGVRAINAGPNHSLFVKFDGTVRGAGVNSSGQLGDGTTTSPRLTSVPMIGVTGAVAVAAGGGHSIVQLADGTLRATGQGTNLGQGNNTNRSTPVAVTGLTDVIAIAAGNNHTLALRADGSVWAWGATNSNGQQGDGTTNARLSPVQVVGLVGVTGIGAGADQSLAVTGDGVVYTWGDNGFGQLGDGADRSRLVPTPIGEANYTWKTATPTLSISGGSYAANVPVVVNVLSSGATIHYTRNGIEPTQADPTVATGGTVLVDVSQTLTVKAFKAGLPPSNTEAQTYTLQATTPTVSPNVNTQTAPVTVTLATTTAGATLYYTVDGSDPTLASIRYTSPFVVATSSTVKAIATRTGWSTSAVGSRTYTMNFGTLAAPVISPGAGTYIGSVTVSLSSPQPGATIRYTTTGGGVGTASPVYTAPFALTTTTTVKAKAFHPDYTASAEASAVFSVQAAAPVFSLAPGAYAPGTAVTITGDPATTIRYTLDGTDPTTSSPLVTPGATVTLGNFTVKARAFLTGANPSAVASAAYTLTGSFGPPSMAAGAEHSFAITADGRVFGWGYNAYGQLGDGTNTSRPLPVLVNELTGVVAMASSQGEHSLAVTFDGRLLAWGYNVYGAVGDGTTTARNRPVHLSSLTGVVAVAAGQLHSVALLGNGDAYTWGYNAGGQLGDGTTANRSVPRLAMSGVRAIAAGTAHTLFVKVDGTVWATGSNNVGQLGDGTTTARLSPVQMGGITGAVAAAAGGGTSVVLLADGSIRATGTGSLLGDGTSITRTTPVAVVGINNAVALGGGYNHTVALRADGTVWGWGASSAGQLGNPSANTYHLTPLPAIGTATFTALAAGGNHTLALTGDGVVYSWGSNGRGEIGDGGNRNRVLPTPISIENYTWKVATPTLSINTGTYSANQSVVVSALTPGATIHYTRTGVEPSEADPTVAAGSTVLVDMSQTLTAKAFKAGMPPSNADAQTYTLQVPAVFPSVGSGTYPTPRTVTLPSPTPGATVYYTTDGAEPTETSTLYTGAFTVATTTTLKTKGFKTGWTPSSTWTTTYTMNFGTLAAPVIAPGAGLYVGSVTWSVSAAQPGVTIRYTTTGGGVGTSSPVYTAPFALTTTTTVKAKAFHPDYTASAESSTVFTVQTTAPVFSLAPGAYAPGTAVTITGDPATTVRYSVDGTVPTATHTAIASGGSVLLGAFTLKARAFRTGALESGVVSATYALTTALGPGAIAGGGSHSVLATPDGRVFTWGYNGQGQLGDGSSITRPTAVQVSDLTGVVAIAAGELHSLAVTVDGRLFTWGHNGYGQLGDGTTTNRTRPVPIAPLTAVVGAASGYLHSVVLLANGDAYTWGYNYDGQLGDGTTTTTAVPRLVMSGVRAVAAGYYHTLFVKNDGTVWGTGLNGNGQLGDGTTTQRLTPMPMTGITTAVAAAAGASFSVVQLSDGTLRAAGAGSLVGDGTQTRRTTPVPVPGMTAVVAIDAGSSHTVALKSDGSVWAWGYNSSGQVGNLAATAYQLSPLPATGVSNVAAIGAGADHTLAVSALGVVSVWGSNSLGQLGDGGNRNRPLPTPISAEDYTWKVGTPTLSINSGTYAVNQSVVVNTVTPGASIHYTRNGVEPTEADPTVAPGGTVLVDVSQTLTVKAFKMGMPPSNADAQIYTMQVPQPTMVPSTGGPFAAPQNVTLSTATTGASVYYTIDGSEPTQASTLYTGAFSVGTQTTVKSKGFKTGWTSSTTRSQTLSFNYGTLTAPTISPGAGTSVGSVTVTLSAAQPGASIRYTTTGATVGTGSPLYTGAFTLTATSTVKAKTFHPDYTTSAESSAAFTVQVSTPTLTLASGTYAPGTAVIVNGNPAATIRVSLDGVDPTPSHPSVVAGSTMLIGSFTLKARAFKTGAVDSGVASATYALTTPIGPGAVAMSTFSTGHGLVATPTGRVLSWGRNLSGEVGDGTFGGFRSTATLIHDLTGVVAVAAGRYHSLALTLDGRVFVWGTDVGNGAAYVRPTRVASLTNVVAIAAGDAHDLALTSSGEVYAWGDNAYSQLGNGSGIDSAVPMLVAGLPAVAGIAAGADSSFAVTVDGQLFAWGLNNAGQAGQGYQTLQVSTPLVVPALSGVETVVAEGAKVAARLRSGRLFLWGHGYTGALGTGGEAIYTTPIETSASPAVSVALGYTNGGALGLDGKLRAWGSNQFFGNVGDGTYINRFSPTLVQGPPDISTFTINSTAVAITPGGAVWTWGSGQYGELGDGTNPYSRATPQVAFTVAEPWAPAAPVFSVAPGTYGNQFTLIASSPMPGAVIRYTLDGSTPTEADAEAVNGEIFINASLTVRARVFVPGRAPSAITAGAYVITP